MRQTVHFREPLTKFPDTESLNKRAAEGWRISAIEWERDVEVVQRPPLAPMEVPFGLKVSSDCWHLEEDSREVAVLTEIMELLLLDYSLSRVADELNSRGHRMRDQAKWDPVSIFNLLPRIVEVGPRIFSDEQWRVRSERINKLLPTR
jgi:hypothetical protein